MYIENDDIRAISLHIARMIINGTHNVSHDRGLVKINESLTVGIIINNHPITSSNDPGLPLIRLSGSIVIRAADGSQVPMRTQNGLAGCYAIISHMLINGDEMARFIPSSKISVDDIVKNVDKVISEYPKMLLEEFLSRGPEVGDEFCLISNAIEYIVAAKDGHDSSACYIIKRKGKQNQSIIFVDGNGRKLDPSSIRVANLSRSYNKMTAMFGGDAITTAEYKVDPALVSDIQATILKRFKARANFNGYGPIRYDQYDLNNRHKTDIDTSLVSAIRISSVHRTSGASNLNRSFFIIYDMVDDNVRVMIKEVDESIAAPVVNCKDSYDADAVRAVICSLNLSVSSLLNSVCEYTAIDDSNLIYNTRTTRKVIKDARSAIRAMIPNIVLYAAR